MFTLLYITRLGKLNEFIAFEFLNKFCFMPRFRTLLDHRKNWKSCAHVALQSSRRDFSAHPVE